MHITVPYKKITISAFCLLCLLITQGVMAADKYGQFGVRGAGLITCQIYVHEREAKADVYLMTAGWVDGYITATNQHAADTYDIMSFETTELLTEVLFKHCSNNPNDNVFAVLKSLFTKLHNDRLTDHSKKIDVVMDERSVSLYVETLKRIQQKLVNTGLYRGEIDGVYGEAMIEAMKNYQIAIKFKPTGFPDQATLWHLLRSAE